MSTGTPMGEPRHLAAAGKHVPEAGGAAAVPLPIAVPALQIAPPLPALTRGELFAVAIAAVLHAALLLAVVAERVTRVGGGGSLDEIVSIEIVEAVPAERLIRGDWRPLDRGRPAPEDGAAEPAPETAAARPVDGGEARSDEPPPPALPELEEPGGEAARALVAPRAGEGNAREGEAAGQNATEGKTEAASEASQPADAGGGLRGTHVTELPGVSIAMASGAAQGYAKEVLETLARARPKVDPGTAGRVHFAFAVAQSGHPVAVRITRSSGSRHIDEATLAALRDLRFPVPPAGLRGSDLLYETYIDFRPER